MSNDTLQKLEETSNEGITKTHVLFSITTLPCRFPIVLECCINMREEGDLNYLVVYERDKDFLRKQNVSSITNLAEFTRRELSPEQLEKSWREMMLGDMKYPDWQLYNLATLTREKIRTWEKESNEVALPLRNMFGLKP